MRKTTIKIPLAAAFISIACLLMTACRDSEEVASVNEELTYPYQAVGTIGMIADVVRNIAGEKAQVTGIIGEGVDPHLYQPTSADVKLLQSAEVIFYNGLNLEGKMGDVLVRVAKQGVFVTAVTETLLERETYVMSDEEDHYDPHVWMDVKGWMAAAEVMRDRLVEFDPLNQSVYKENTEAYLEKLEKLDAYGKEMIGSIPEERRVLVTAHDAFNYMGRAYGLNVRGIQGISTGSEAGLKDMNDLVDFLVEKDIPAVFVESSVAQKNVRALIEGAAARGHEVTVGGELFSDAMGETGTYEGTYVGMLDHNFTTISRALGGAAPAGGFQGKLGSK